MAPPLCLIIMDGWGINPRTDGSAVAQGKTPVLELLSSSYPHSVLQASGMHVGLPDGQMGNSEVGHLNIGAGRIVYQEFTRISKSIKDGDFFKNRIILDAISSVKKNGTSLHLMGLLSDGGVHSHMEHLFALVDMAGREGIERVFIHALMDGRDTPPRSGSSYIKATEEFLRKRGIGRIATVIGRYYGMDRDNRWDRVKLAYDAMVHGQGMEAASASEAMEASYARDEGDEFVRPTVIKDEGRPLAVMGDGDAVIFFNFRSDRTREITRALNDDQFDGFERGKRPALASFVCMTEYDETFTLPIAFPPVKPANILGEVLSKAGLRQLRIAETEKYAHVTFFFNGGVEEPFPGEERKLVPSPNDVATYDLKPEMSAVKVADAAIELIEKDLYDLIILNFANGDMVGHTGVMPAAIKAVETVDACVGRVVDAVRKKGGSVLITADHGNAEQMVDYKTGSPHTAHTTNPVPFILVDDRRKGMNVRDGILADLAPTILQMLNIPVPKEMEGKSLLA